MEDGQSVENEGEARRSGEKRTGDVWRWRWRWGLRYAGSSLPGVQQESALSGTRLPF